MLDLTYKPEVIVDTSNMSNEEWLKWRRHGLGGSDVSVLFGVNPWTTKRELYLDKTEGFRMDPPNQYTLDFGHALEPFVAEWFEKAFHEPNSQYKSWLEKQMGIGLEEFHVRRDPAMYRNPLHPVLQADLDFRFTAIDINGEVHEGIFECKTTNPDSFMKKWGWNKVPEYYVWQCREYMEVMNLDSVIIACASGNNESNYAMGYITRDLGAEEDLIETAEDFWNNNVLAHNPPQLTENEKLVDEEFDNLLAYEKAKHENEDISKMQPLSASEIELCKNILALKDKIAEQEKTVKGDKSKKKILETKLLEMTEGKPATGVLDENNNIVASIKQTTRNGIDHDKLKKEYPDIEKACLKSVSSESMNIKVIKA